MAEIISLASHGRPYLLRAVEPLKPGAPDAVLEVRADNLGNVPGHMKRVLGLDLCAAPFVVDLDKSDAAADAAHVPDPAHGVRGGRDGSEVRLQAGLAGFHFLWCLKSLGACIRAACRLPDPDIRLGAWQRGVRR